MSDTVNINDPLGGKQPGREQKTEEVEAQPDELQRKVQGLEAQNKELSKKLEDATRRMEQLQNQYLQGLMGSSGDEEGKEDEDDFLQNLLSHSQEAGFNPEEDLTDEGRFLLQQIKGLSEKFEGLIGTKGETLRKEVLRDAALQREVEELRSAHGEIFDIVAPFAGRIAEQNPHLRPKEAFNRALEDERVKPLLEGLKLYKVQQEEAMKKASLNEKPGQGSGGPSLTTRQAFDKNFERLMAGQEEG